MKDYEDNGVVAPIGVPEPDEDTQRKIAEGWAALADRINQQPRKRLSDD